MLSVYREWGPWRRWILPEGHKGDNDNGQEEQGEREKDAIRKAITAAMDKDDESGADGEWVAVLGFSQGAKVAASVMMGQQLRHQRKRRERSGFRFAVLVAGRGPMIGEAGIDLDGGDSSDQRSHYVDSEGEGATKAHGYSDALLRLPTIHVHGRQDPGLELHCHFLEESFQRGSARLVEWDGGHRLPVKSKDVDVVVDAILGIARENGVL